MSLYIVVKDELDSARTQMEAVEREREEQRALMLAVFKEKEETEFQLAAMVYPLVRVGAEDYSYPHVH